MTVKRVKSLCIENIGLIEDITIDFDKPLILFQWR
jgi:hypothetical protein